MNTMKHFNQSKSLSIAIYTCCFIFLFLCNCMTLFILDDYTYMFSFADHERITRISQIIPSMIAHAQTMNGRLVAHTLVQIFALVPTWLFDLVNAGVFVLQIALIVRIGCGKGSRSNLLTLAVFCAIWLYEPNFSHVNLWQDGAVNYLWSIIFGLLYLLPYIDDFLFDAPLASKPKQLLFLVVAFLTGAYSETVSSAVIFMAALLLLLSFFLHKRKLRPYLLTGILIAFIGYVTIYLAPAQWMNKSAGTSVKLLLVNFVHAVEMYASFGILVISYVVLTILCIAQNRRKKRILLAGVFFAGSLAANFIMVLALYYSGRSAVGAFILLLCANVILLQELMQSDRYREACVCALAVLVLAAFPAVCSGTLDIASTYTEMKANEIYICQSRDQGVMDVSIPNVTSDTKYGIAYEALSLDSQDPTSWMNQVMARFYGVDTILGIEPGDN